MSPGSPWCLLLLIGVLLLVACGGQTPVATTDAQTGGVQSDDSGQAQAPQPPTPGSASNAAFNPCDSFGLLGTAASGFTAQSAGANIETSGTPQSQLSDNVGEFAAGALEEALDGDVSADCFLEFSSQGETGVWVALTLPDTLSSGAANQLSAAMAERGATVSGTMTTAAQGATFDLVAFEALPFDAPTGADLTGALYLVTSNEGAYMAVMVASFNDSSNDSGSDSSSDSGSDTSGGPAEREGSPGEGDTPGPTQPPVAVTPSGLAKTVNDRLEPALEEALGIDLVLSSFFQTGSDGNNAITLSYAYGEPLPSLEEGAVAMTGVIEGLGGNVTFNMSAAEGATALFEQLIIGELSLSGTLSLSPDAIVALVSFEG